MEITLSIMNLSFFILLLYCVRENVKTSNREGQATIEMFERLTKRIEQLEAE